MANPVGVFDAEIRQDAWFDAEIIVEAWFDKDLVADVVTSVYASAILADGPRAYWRLGELTGAVFADSSGNGNHGAFSGGVTLGATGAITGDTDAAVLLNGSTGQGAVPDSTTLDLGSGTWSVEFWAKLTRVTGVDGVVLDKGSQAYEVLFYPNHDFFSLAWGHSAITVSSTVQETLDATWHHYVATKGVGATYHLYRDSVDVTGVATDHAYIDTATSLIIGNESGGEDFDGSLDEIALYASVLTPTQVLNHYTLGAGVVGSVASYPFAGGGFYP